MPGAGDTVLDTLESFPAGFLYSNAGVLSWGPAAVSGDIFGCQNWEGAAPGIQCIEARYAAKRPAVHRMVPTTENGPASNVRRLRSWRGVPVGEADTQADKHATMCHTASELREWELCKGIDLVKWRAGWGGHPRQRDQ